MSKQGFTPLEREDTDEQQEGLMSPAGGHAHADDGSAFYLNCEVLGKDDRA
jgi:hypothetical protein